MSLTDASYRRRALAFAIDALIGLSPLWLLLPVSITFASHPGATDRLAAHALLLVAPIPSLALYFGIQVVQISRGAPTVGRRLAGIEIVMSNGNPTGFKAAARREVLGVFLPLAVFAFVGVLPLIGLLGLFALLNPNRRSFPDFVAGTRVINLADSKRGRLLPWEAPFEEAMDLPSNSD